MNRLKKKKGFASMANVKYVGTTLGEVNTRLGI